VYALGFRGQGLGFRGCLKDDQAYALSVGPVEKLNLYTDSNSLSKIKEARYPLSLGFRV
jgi:hypothetical protein